MAYHPFRHPGLKVLSVGIAAFLWYAVAGEQPVERSLRVPLELQNVPDSLEVVGDPPSTVDVRVRGPSGTLSRLGPGDVVAVLDLTNARAGRRLFHLTPEQVRAPFGVDIAQVGPATVPMSFERSAQQVVPVVPSVEGQPAAGFQIAETSSDPANVEIVGPESLVRSVDEAITEPVSVAGTRTTVRESVTIGVADPAVRVKSAKTARVTIRIVPLPSMRTLEDVPLRAENLRKPLAASVTPQFVQVTVKGPQATINAMPADAVTAFVELAGLGPGRYNLTVHVRSAHDVEVTSIEPAAVVVSVR